MNLPSTRIHIDIASVGNYFVVVFSIEHEVGSSAITSTTLVLRSREELQSWLANLEIKT